MLYQPNLNITVSAEGYKYPKLVALSSLSELVRFYFLLFPFRKLKSSSSDPDVEQCVCVCRCCVFTSAISIWRECARLSIYCCVQKLKSPRARASLIYRLSRPPARLVPIIYPSFSRATGFVSTCRRRCYILPFVCVRTRAPACIMYLYLYIWAWVRDDRRKCHSIFALPERHCDVWIIYARRMSCLVFFFCFFCFAAA